MNLINGSLKMNMIMKQLFLCMLLMCSVCSFAQTVALTFITQDTVTVRVAKPVDGNYNSYYYETLKLFPKQDEVYSFGIKDLGLVYLKYSTGEKYDLYVYPNAKLTINYDNGRIFVEGDSASGSEYLNYGYYKDYTRKLNKRYSSYIQKEHSLLETLNFCDSLPHIDHKIEELLLDGQITPQIADAIKKKGRYDECKTLLDLCHNILANEDMKIQRSDSALIYETIDSIYKSCPPDSCFTKYQPSLLYLILYYEQYKYPRLSESDKEMLLKEYSNDTFGPFKPYLAASESQRMSMFFVAFMSQYKYRVNELDRKKMLDYFAKEFPESESFSIISKTWQENQLLNDEPVLISDTVSCLKDLMTLDSLKGNYAFIDLWATWCIPCREEFTYNSELYKLLESYANLTLLYVSIDKNEKAWFNTIHQNLPGLHLRATKKLTEDIKDKIYANGRLSVPRYVLLDPEGNVVNSNMSRPSQIDNLKKELDEVLMH